jgi:hypothetical protein
MRTARSDNLNHANPPLWPIGLAVLLVFMTPLILASLAPSGPLRAGDSIFSEGQQQAVILRRASTDPRPQEDTCLLDPGNPLIIIQPPADRLDAKVQAQVQGNQITDWPFCPPLTEVLLRPNQIIQKPDMLKAVQDKTRSLLRH